MFHIVVNYNIIKINYLIKYLSISYHITLHVHTYTFIITRLCVSFLFSIYPLLYTNAVFSLPVNTSNANVSRQMPLFHIKCHCFTSNAILWYFSSYCCKSTTSIHSMIKQRTKDQSKLVLYFTEITTVATCLNETTGKRTLLICTLDTTV